MATAEHTSKQFGAELEAVRAHVLQMGGLVEYQLVCALHALVSGDLILANGVVEEDQRVNAFEELNEGEKVIARSTRRYESKEDAFAAFLKLLKAGAGGSDSMPARKAKDERRK